MSRKDYILIAKGIKQLSNRDEQTRIMHFISNILCSYSNFNATTFKNYIMED